MGGQAAATPGLAVLLVTIVAATLVFTPWTGDAFGLPKLTVVGLGVVAVTALTVTGAVVRVPRLPKALAVAVAALLATTAVSTATSIAPMQSLVGRYERYSGLLPLVIYVALAGAVVVVTAGRRDRLLLVAAAVVGGATVAAWYVLVQFAGLDPLEWREPSGRLAEFQAGTLGNSNFAGAHFGVALALVPMLVVSRLGWLRIVGVVGGLSCGAGAIAAGSRGGLLAAAVATAASSLMLLSRVSWSRRAKASLVAGGAGVAVLCIALLSQTSLGRGQSFEVRKRQWAAAVDVVRDRPVVGAGPDTFQLVFPQHRDRQDGRELGLQIADKPHNLVLEHAAASGVPGALAYLAVIAIALMTAWRAATARPEERLVVGGFAAGIAAHAAQGMFSIDVPSLAMIWWVCIGAIASVAAAEPPETASGATVATRRPASVAVTAVALVVALVVAWAITRPWRADWAAAGGEFATATALAPYEVVHHLNRGGAATARLADATSSDEATAAVQEAERAYSVVVARQPRNVFGHVGIGRLYGVIGALLDPAAFARADVAYTRAAELDPYDWQVYDEWAAMLTRWSNAAGGDERLRRRALQTYERLLDIRPDHAPAWENLARTAAALGDDATAAEARAEAARLQG